MSETASKERADRALVSRGLVETRARAQDLITSGKVLCDGVQVKKAGQSIKSDQKLELSEEDHPWVSRGGLKLAGAIKAFGLDPAGMTAIDVGASTGGFTDVLLQHGAAKVYAVDVGRDQLATKLRDDKRVVVMEKTNARYLDAELIPDPIDYVVCDASFIGLRTVLPAAMGLVKPGGQLIALIKPQFEVGKDRVGKGGIVRDPDLHDEVCQTIRNWLNDLPDWEACDIERSPITGPDGNIEFLIHGKKAL